MPTRAETVQRNRKSVPLQAAEAVREVAPQAAQTVTTQAQGSRTVVGFIGFAVVFALLGNEIRHPVPKGGHPGKVAGLNFTEPGLIIFGGFTAAALLTLISRAGDAGRQFAVGLSAVTLVSSMLINGQDVFKAIRLGTGATQPTRGSSPSNPLPSNPSAPTGSTAFAPNSIPLQII